MGRWLSSAKSHIGKGNRKSLVPKSVPNIILNGTYCVCSYGIRKPAVEINFLKIPANTSNLCFLI